MNGSWGFAAALLTALVLPTPAMADGGDASAAVRTFRDGPRQIEVRRKATQTTDPLGRALTTVELRYPHLAHPIPAAIDRHAIVELDPKRARDKLSAQAALDGLGARVVKPLMPTIGLWLVENARDGDGLDLARRLDRSDAAARGIGQAAPDLYLRVERREPWVPDDPEFGGQWFWENLNMTEAWGLTQGNAETSIVIVDTGCDLTHPDLVGKLDPGRDVIDDDDDPSFIPGEQGAAHGTECAGLAAADTNNGEGVAGGCPECRLRCVRLLTDALHPVSDTVEAFDFALQTGAAVVSNSWGYVDPIPAPQVLADAINNVFANGRGGMGALVLFAAGNDNRELGPDEVEGVAGVLCIGAINHFDEQTPFTNFGSPVDLVAYTGTVTTDIVGSAGSEPGDYTSSFGGTSSACPVAAGIAGLVASEGTDRSADELYALLIDNAKPAPYAAPDQYGHDPVFGFGIIDPVASLRDGLGLTEPEEQPDAGTEPPPPPDPEDDGGCTVSGSTGGSAGLSWAALLALATAIARRRRQP